jgi:uncharacterized protein YjgD (DUF1641 family)
LPEKNKGNYDNSQMMHVVQRLEESMEKCMAGVVAAINKARNHEGIGIVGAVGSWVI